MIFPAHAASLHLTHNQHKAYYETIEQYIGNFEIGNWINEEEKAKAFETQDMWELQWYPDTPIGFHLLWAHSLEALLAAALKE